MKSKHFHLFSSICLAVLIFSLAVILVYLPSARKDIGQLSQVPNAYASFAAIVGFDAYLGWIFIFQSLAFFVSWLTAAAIWFLYSHHPQPASPAILLTCVVLALVPLLMYPGLNALPPGLPGLWNFVFTLIALILEFAAFPSLVLLYFIFPMGSFNPRWSRWLAYPLIVLFITAGVLVILGPASPFSAIIQPVLLINMVVGIVFQIIAFFRLSSSERLRSWPVSLALVLLPVLFILPDLVSGSSQAAITLLSQFAMLLALPVSVWIALGSLNSGTISSDPAGLTG